MLNALLLIVLILLNIFCAMKYSSFIAVYYCQVLILNVQSQVCVFISIL